MELYDPTLQPGLRLTNLAAKLIGEGRREEAVCAAIGACEIECSRPEPYIALAAAYDQFRAKGLEKYQAEAARAAIELAPGAAPAWHNLSLAQERLYQWEEALESANKAHLLEPQNPWTLAHAAGLVNQLGDPATGTQMLTGALNLFPKSKYDDGSPAAEFFMRETYAARSISKLECGDLAGHFEDQHRWMPLGMNFPATCLRNGILWRPWEPVRDRVCIFLQGGLGDQIQFLRLVKPFREANPQIVNLTVIADEPLRLLFGNIALPIDNWIAIPLNRDQIIASLDLVEWAWINGAEHPFGAWTGPYIGTPRKAQLRRESPCAKTAIGFYWQGNPKHPYDWARSIPLFEFLNWAESKRSVCTFHSLQHGEKQFPLPDWIEDCDRKEFSELAEVIQACDVIVGPDSGLSHLAGAMAKPTVMLLSAHQDWRWRLSTKFYASSFRRLKQNRRGDWPELFSRLGGELDRLLNAIETNELMAAMAR